MANLKIKTLKLLEILYTQTDENNRLKTNELINILAAQGYKCDRRSIYDDIEAFREIGCDIKKERGYYVASRALELPEVKILLDAVASSEFLTAEQTDELASKLVGLLSDAQAEQLKYQFYTNTLIKNRATEEQDIFHTVDTLSYAIHWQRQVKFNYIKNDRKKAHFVSPYSLIWNNQRYYIVGFDYHLNEISHFRVEKISDVELTGRASRPINEVSDYESELDSADYLISTYNMFSGEICKAKIKFHIDIIDEFKKHFDNGSFKSCGKNYFLTEVEVAESDGFVSFALSYGDKLQVLEPESLADRIGKKAQEIANMYNKGAVEG